MRLSTGRRPFIARVRSHLTPAVVGLSFFGILAASAIVGIMANALSIKQMLQTTGTSVPLVIGMSATPKPMQYENQIRVHSQRGTVTLPVHTGNADMILGPLELSVAHGATVTWTPGADFDPTLLWVFAISNVDGVLVSGAGGGIYQLKPGAYLPNATNLPLVFSNQTSSDAKVAIVVGVDYEISGGGEDL